MATRAECERALALEQGSVEWLAFKAGRVGGSRVADITAKLKDGRPGAARATYLGELIAERLTGVSYDNYKSAAMQWGNDIEPMARSAYQFKTLREVERVGCVLHPRIDYALCSPDGFIGRLGLVEFKCPNTSTHIDFILGAAIPSRYFQQMQWGMACTGRAWCDYVSFDPRLPEHLRMRIKTVRRDNALISILEKEVEEFLRDAELRVVALERTEEVAA